MSSPCAWLGADSTSPMEGYNGVETYNRENEEIYLFDSDLLRQLDWTNCDVQFKGNVNISYPGQNLKVRPLSNGDFDRSYMQLLSQLTSIGNVTEENFQERFINMQSCSKTYYIIVVEDVALNKVVGTVSVIIEQKFIHDTGLRSRIEDVVVDEEYRGRQLGKLLVQIGVLLSKHLGCYKVSLECKEHNVKFYEPFGFHLDQKYLVKRFKQ